MSSQKFVAISRRVSGFVKGVAGKVFSTRYVRAGVNRTVCLSGRGDQFFSVTVSRFVGVRSDWGFQHRVKDEAVVSADSPGLDARRVTVSGSIRVA